MEECYLHSSMGVFHVFKLYEWYQIAQSTKYIKSACFESKFLNHLSIAGFSLQLY